MIENASRQNRLHNDIDASGVQGARRGVLSVLMAAVCLAVVTAAAMHTWQLVAILGIEQKLHRTAEIAAREATLPNADRSSIEQVVACRLRRDGLRAGRRIVAVEQGHGLSRRPLHAGTGDCISITISLPSSTVLPPPLVRWSAMFGPQQIQATAERSL